MINNSDISAHPATMNKFPSCVWKTFGDGEQLKATIISPKSQEDATSEEALVPGIFFFHGGYWRHGDINEFIPWAIHLAEKGVVSVLFEYRQPSMYDVSALEPIRDAEDAWNWMRTNALSLGIDPEKIIVAGNDAGGLMALLLAMAGGKPSKKNPPRPVPAALITLRPFIDCTKNSLLYNTFPNNKLAKEFSPDRLVRKGLPPLFIALGGKDKFIPFKSTLKFAHSYEKKKNKVHLLSMEEADQSFLLFDKHATLFEYTLREALLFLADCELIKPLNEEEMDLLQ